ncbi:MAG: hypothetical protein SF182_03405 [Deltaproteobacteria bacterium]|nr:hypothetical protein [Deltaproteobacteria bacterium]
MGDRAPRFRALYPHGRNLLVAAAAPRPYARRMGGLAGRFVGFADLRRALQAGRPGRAWGPLSIRSFDT